MTVAVAALCKMNGVPLIIAAEDHMITAGDVEFEQPQPKMWYQGPHSLAMLYGDSAAQTEIALQSSLETTQRRVSDVADIAKIYHKHLHDHVRGLAEAEVLFPLNLNADSFLTSTNTLGFDLASSLTRRMQNYFFDRGLDQCFGGSIIVGADSNGGHIFKVEYGESTRLDRIGFAAAGAGRWHAESQFMFSRYTPEWEHPETLSLVYSAKKRAEVAPGVGSETDIVMIFTNPLNVMHFTYDSVLVSNLEQIYQNAKTRHEEATASQHQDVRRWFDALAAANPSVTTPAPTSTPVVSAPETPKQSNVETSEPGP